MSPAGSSRPAELVSGVAATLCVSSPAAEGIVVAFERFVAEPVEQNLECVKAHAREAQPDDLHRPWSDNDR